MGLGPLSCPPSPGPRMLPVVSPHQVRISHSQVVATTSVYPLRESWPCRSVSLSSSRSGFCRSCPDVQRVYCLFFYHHHLTQTPCWRQARGGSSRNGSWLRPALNCMATPCRSTTLRVGAGQYSSFEVTSAVLRPLSSYAAFSSSSQRCTLTGRHTVQQFHSRCFTQYGVLHSHLQMRRAGRGSLTLKRSNWSDLPRCFLPVNERTCLELSALMLPR